VPELDHTAQILDETPSSELMEIQKNRAQSVLQDSIDKLTYPLPWPMVGFTVALTLITAGLFFLLQESRSVATPHPILESLVADSLASDLTSPDSLFLEELVITVQPPAYTGEASFISKSFDFTAPEGSKIALNGHSSIENTTYAIHLNGKPVQIKTIAQTFSSNFFLKQKTIYQILLTSGDRQFQSPFRVIDVRKDLPPTISKLDIPQYQRFNYQDNPTILVEIGLTDDYGLTDAYIMATVTQGSGESIRFQQQKLNFDKPITGKAQSVSTTLSAVQFDMEPGNELYFHIEAIDNKRPTSQITKTSTYFFAIIDTTEVAFSLAGDLGVDLMPAYFKSQLQLIIDTEQLISEKTSLKKSDFNTRSNELGFEQKQLRLRYGQFMGEEEDAGLEVTQVELEESSSNQVDPQGSNVLQEFGHDHDHENEEGAWMDKGTETHNHETTEEESPLEAYLHLHEDEETASFFSISLKAKLRAALNEMWDAELYLRMYQPQKSLPYQYKAQKLLKEIKNHARIYVKRVGFEPIPINEAKIRLSKEPEGTEAQNFKIAKRKTNDYPAISALLNLLNTVRQGQVNINSDIWQSAGREVATVFLTSPGQWVTELNVIQLLSQKEVLDEKDIYAISVLSPKLYGLLGSDQDQPSVSAMSANKLEQEFIQSSTNLLQQ
jgi:hypothetical protein